MREEGEAAYRCVNPECPAQLARSLEHYVSRDAMDIEGCGEAQIAQLISAGLLKSAADLYALKAEDLTKLERMGEKSSENLIKSIENSKTRGLARLLYGLGIRHVGKQTAKSLAEHFETLENLMNASEETLTEIEDIGNIVAKSISDYFSRPGSLHLCARLKEYGVETEMKSTKVSDALSGYSFVITGTLAGIKRDDAAKLIQDNGGKVISSVSKNTNFLLCGSDAGSKLDKAQKLGIPIIGIDELYAMINQ